MELSRHLSLLLLVLISLLAPPPAAAAKAYANITLGTTFTPLGSLSSWNSSSGDFAFGFRGLDTDPSLYLLAVWFARDPNHTVVWYANGNAPVPANSTAELEAAGGGRLSLKDHTGKEIWGAGGGAPGNTSYAAILDSGNLVLSGGAGAAPVWQSFDNPTDTLLPSQTLPIGGILHARLMDDDYSNGRFQLVLQNNGNLSLYFAAVPSGFLYDSYWGSDTNGSAITLVFDHSGAATYLSGNGGEIRPLTSSNFITGNYYQRATLDPDGIFRHYALPRDHADAWEVQDAVPSGMCNSVPTKIGSGVCGFNSYCQLDAGGRVDCQCPPKYSFIDPDRKYMGCKRDFPAQSCEPREEALYDFVLLKNIDWPLNAAEELSPMSEVDCRSNCLRDCLCTAAIYKSNICWKKRYPLSNGRDDGDVARVAYIKYSNTSNSYWTTSPENDKEKIGSKPASVVILSILFGGVVLLNLALVSAWWRRRRRPTDPVGLQSFTYKELDQATNGFREQVGRGAFGTVYKGVLPEIPTAIAIKKLESGHSNQENPAEKDFINEVRTIGQTHHKNLVRMHGFCKEGTHRLLVYEFMSNGSLNTVLFGSDPPEWSRRAEIAVDIAAGLAYLHEECRTPRAGTQIIHCDIKPQNILLDGELRARISDFGLAKLLGLQQTRTSTGVRGTIGYFAPEWFKMTAVTAKVDVYSFGVVLLEIVCCKRNLEWEVVGSESGGMMTLAERAAKCYRSGRIGELVEENEETMRDAVRLERYVMVALWCVQEESWMRPTMKKVVQMLEGSVAVSVPPVFV